MPGLPEQPFGLGNALTNGVSLFRVQGFLPNIAIDTTAGGHTVQLGPRFGGSAGTTYVHNVNIGPGGILDVGFGLISNYRRLFC